MNFGFLKRIVTFGGDEVAGRSAPTKLDYGYKGSGGSGGPEAWIDMPQAQAMVDRAVTEKGFLGMAKYSNRDEAERAVAEKLWAAKTGIKRS